MKLTHAEALAAAQQMPKDHPELHAEYLLRRKSGTGFTKGEPVYDYFKRYMALNERALKAAKVF